MKLFRVKCSYCGVDTGRKVSFWRWLLDPSCCDSLRCRVAKSYNDSW